MGIDPILLVSAPPRLCVSGSCLQPKATPHQNKYRAAGKVPDTVSFLVRQLLALLPATPRVTVSGERDVFLLGRRRPPVRFFERNELSSLRVTRASSCLPLLTHEIAPFCSMHFLTDISHLTSLGYIAELQLRAHPTHLVIQIEYGTRRFILEA